MKTIVALLSVFASCSLAAAEIRGSGRWEGSASLPDRKIAVVLDLRPGTNGSWTGSLSLPDDHAVLELGDIKVKENNIFAVSKEKIFAVDAELSPDGSIIKGGFLSALVRNVPVAMQLTRSGDAEVHPAPASSRIGKALEGCWDGVVTYGAASSETVLKPGSTRTARFDFAGGTDPAKGRMSDPKDGKPAVELTVVRQDGDRIRLEARQSGIVYTGVLNGNEIAGEWRQFGADPVKVTLKRVSE